ncbi:MAG TPA: 2,3-bisphosphoglycerate-independent phosphoglycerate mutase [Thermoanaerobaculia bacterium]|nr:2,3-bisphosphoglycerate-independent phosphoglycerate mutase [Thermoanaerobaculia bacterium]
MAERGSGGERRREVWVRTSSGARRPFLRGMVTHELVQRGLPFDEAYAVARAVRDAVAERDEIDTVELAERIERHLDDMVAPERRRALAAGGPPAEPEVTVLDHGQPQPFSRGLLARNLFAAGVDLDRAYRLVGQLQAELRRERVSRLAADDLGRRMADLLERFEGAEVASRYRLLRSIRRLPRPLVLYLGGAPGTGKSTLAVDLAPLLRMYRINATDTVRQVMRMVFSPAVLPALHRSSYQLDEEVAAPGWTRRRPSRRRIEAAFLEQAVRVLVGVRAVVERSVAESVHVVVEGVHLVPPLVPFPDLEGAAYQVMLLLTTLDEEAHRSRFLARDRAGGRRGERYLQSFAHIRRIQELLLDRAEAHDVPLLETRERDASLQHALELVTGLLRQRVPHLAAAVATPVKPPPTLLLFVDGMADRPVRALGGRTPLAVGVTPTLDRLAREGRSGLADPLAPGVTPDTAAGSLAIFGQPPRALARGPVEAIGAGLELGPDDVALRANLATIDEAGRLVDRRAGRIREGVAELAAALDRLPLPGMPVDRVGVRVRPGTEHRLALVLSGRGLSSAIAGSDPGDGAPPGPPLVPRPLDPHDDAATKTARVLALFEQEARRVLADHPVNRARRERGLPPANAVLTRGAGHVHRLLPLEYGGMALSAACISGDRTVLGIAATVGAETITSDAMTANLDTDLPGKFAAAARALSDHDLVVLHVKGADIAAHDRRPDWKVEFLEKLDRRLADLLAAHPGPLRVAVASDHVTLSEAGHHAADPVPVLIWGPGIEPDAVEEFDERSAATGALGRFPLQLLLARLFEPEG